MKKYYSWTKGLFSSTYNIYTDSTLVGSLKNKSLSQSATGSINGKNYIFNTKGFFKQHTEIIDQHSNTLIGNIEYNSWMTKAQINLYGRTVEWTTENIWNTKWKLFDSNGILLNYSGSSTKGRIEAFEDNELQLLIGLYVINSFWQSSLVVLIIVFLPIWLTLFN